MAQTQGKKVDTSHLKLTRPKSKRDEDEFQDDTPREVTAGPVNRIIDLTLNPTRDKMREVTIIDRLQGRLFPIMDTINSLYRDCIEVATYRKSVTLYQKQYRKAMPEQIDVIDELMFRTAQWQKSVQGKNLERAMDLALAETETRTGDEGDAFGGRSGYED